MKKNLSLNRTRLNSLINEEIESLYMQRYIEKNRAGLSEKRNRLLDEGFDSVRVDEQFISALSGIGSRVLGLGASEYTSPESEDLFGGMSSGIRTALEQTALEAVVKAVGLDANVGFGLVLKNTLEQVIRQYSTKELQKMFTSADDCRSISYQIAKETLIILEESAKERALKAAIDSVAGAIGQDFQNSPFFKPVYQNMREKFSEAFDDILDEEELAQSLSDIICDNFNMDSILGYAKDNIGSSFDSVFGNFSNSINTLMNK